MAISALWTGFDSYGKNIEVAKDDKNNFFYRIYQFNGYAMAWSKWTVYDDVVLFKTIIENVYDGSKTLLDANDDTLFEWGFRCLSKIINQPLPKYRLPKIE